MTVLVLFGSNACCDWLFWYFVVARRTRTSFGPSAYRCCSQDEAIFDHDRLFVFCGGEVQIQTLSWRCEATGWRPEDLAGNGNTW